MRLISQYNHIVIDSVKIREPSIGFSHLFEQALPKSDHTFLFQEFLNLKGSIIRGKELDNQRLHLNLLRSMRAIRGNLVENAFELGFMNNMNRYASVFSLELQSIKQRLHNRRKVNTTIRNSMQRERIQLHMIPNGSTHIFGEAQKVVFSELANLYMTART